MKIIKKLLVLSYNVLRYVMLFFRKVFKKKIGTKESAGLGKMKLKISKLEISLNELEATNDCILLHKIQNGTHKLGVAINLLSLSKI